jgi:hypothetical protein
MMILHVRMEEPPAVNQLELWPPKPKYIAKVKCNRCTGYGRYEVIISRMPTIVACRNCKGKGYLEEEVEATVYSRFLVSKIPSLERIAKECLGR